MVSGHGPPRCLGTGRSACTMYLPTSALERSESDRNRAGSRRVRPGHRRHGAGGGPRGLSGAGAHHRAVTRMAGWLWRHRLHRPGSTARLCEQTALRLALHADTEAGTQSATTSWLSRTWRPISAANGVRDIAAVAARLRNPLSRGMRPARRRDRPWCCPWRRLPLWTRHGLRRWAPGCAAHLDTHTARPHAPDQRTTRKHWSHRWSADAHRSRYLSLPYGQRTGTARQHPCWALSALRLRTEARLPTGATSSRGNRGHLRSWAGQPCSATSHDRTRPGPVVRTSCLWD